MSVILLALLTVLAYAGVWSAGFVYDDANWIPFPAGGWDLLARVPGSAPWLAANWLGGGLPWAFHGLVLGLHLLNGWLFWRLLSRWLSPAACLVALTLFWLHPLQVEAVAYVSGGIEVLLTTYLLVAATCLLTVTRVGAIVALGAFWLALTLKLSALPLLLLLPVLFAIVPSTWVGSLFLVTVFGGMGFGVPAVKLWFLAHPAPFASLGMHLRMVSTAVWGYLALVVLPWGFSADHDWSIALGPIGVLAVLATILVGFLAYIGRPVWPEPWYAWLWLVLLLGPRVIARYDGSPLTEHHVMVPFLAVWAVAGSIVDVPSPHHEVHLYG